MQSRVYKAPTRIKSSPSRIVFLIINYTLLAAYALIALYPLLHLGAISLSLPAQVDAGNVILFPRGLTFQAYEYIFQTKYFLSLFNSVMRLITGVPLNLLMCFLAAYPLSRPKHRLRGRTPIAWFFIVTMLFSGGLVPTYMLVTALGLKNTIFSLILTGAVPVFNVVLMINFFRQIPEDMHEAAEIDGAGELYILFKLYVPLSLPSVVTITLFSIVAHWNSWQDGVLYLDYLEMKPLQAYLQSVVISGTEGDINNKFDQNYVSQGTLDAARLFMAVIPVALMYFPLQKYFIKGLTLGGVKG